MMIRRRVRPDASGSTDETPDGTASSPLAGARGHGSRAHPAAGRLAVAACLAAAVASLVLPRIGPPDPVAMPTAPPWSTALAASAVAVVVLLPSGISRRAHVLAAGLGAGVMAAGSLLALPHTLLMVIIRAAALITDGGGSFTVDPSWSATLRHLAVLAALATTALWALGEIRRGRGRCPRCGRTDDAARVPDADTRRRLRLLATAAIVGALPYAALKLAWSTGSRIGLVGDAFSEVSFASPGFGDTVVLSVLSIVASLVMAGAVRRGAVRIPTAFVGAAASLMLLPVGLGAAAMMLPALFGVYEIDDTAIAPWAFTVVYLSFTGWGLALAALTWTYWRSTASACGNHRAAPVVPVLR